MQSSIREFGLDPGVPTSLQVQEILQEKSLEEFVQILVTEDFPTENDEAAVKDASRALQRMCKLSQYRTLVLKTITKLEKNTAVATSSNPEVRKFACELSWEVISSPSEQTHAGFSPGDILSHFLFDENIEVAEAAVRNLLKMKDLAKDALLSAAEAVMENYDNLETCGKLTAESKVRVFDFSVKIGNEKEEVFKTFQKRGVYDKLLIDFTGDDLLLQLNIAHLVNLLMDSTWGCLFLVSSTSNLDKMITTMESIDVDPLARKESLLLVVKFINQMFLQDNNVPPDLLSRTMDVILEEFEESHDTTAVEALIEIVKTKTGLSMCLQDNSKSSLLFQRTWPLYQKSDDSPLPLAGLMFIEQCVITALKYPDEFQQILKSNANEVPTFVHFFKIRPFPDWRESFYHHFARSIASIDFTRHLLAEDYFIDQLKKWSSEDEYTSKIAKYDFVVQLIEQRESLLKGFLDEDTYFLLTRMKKGGPLYKESLADVMSEAH